MMFWYDDHMTGWGHLLMGFSMVVFARGEIDGDEYQRRLQTLRVSGQVGPT